MNWNYDWNADIPHIAPGMVEGKEPLLDEWEVGHCDRATTSKILHLFKVI